MTDQSANMKTKLKIFTATPMAVLKETDQDYDFFCRDMGLTCYGLRDQGVESQVVLLDFPGAKKHPDMVRTSLEKMADPEWWKSFHLDAVVLGAGAAPRHIPIATAIKQSGAKLIVRCDSGTSYSQWQRSLWNVVYSNYLGPRYNGKGFLYACLYSIAKTPLHYIPSVYMKKVLKHMSYADLILNETPEGVRCLKELLCKYDLAQVAARVKYTPHPVMGKMSCPDASLKKKRIVAVGRWSHYSKNAALLMRVLHQVLQNTPDYEAHLFGGGTDVLEKLLRNMPDSIKCRIHIRGQLPNEQLVAEYQQSQILFMPSRSEGSSIAAEEALACGCSLVGSAHLFCMRNFVSKNSGTLARRYNVSGMVEALTAEMIAWHDGLRDPVRSAEQWQMEVSQQTIAKTIIEAVSK